MISIPTSTAAHDLDAAIAACAAEPIHQPGSIQAGCGMIIYDPVLDQVVGFSDRIANFLPPLGSGTLGDPIGKFWGAPDMNSTLTNEVLTAPEGQYVPLYPGDVSLAKPMDIVGHHMAGLIFIEVLPTSDALGLTAARKMAREVDCLRSTLETATTWDKAIDEAVQFVWELTGYDRVMLYEFDDDGSGTVFAERHSDQLEGFLGLRFPASDIPPQARAMYIRNLTRGIWDVDQPAEPIRPDVHPATTRAFDMTYSLSRSISPVHVQYLKNMGVRASLSISLVKDGALWGLIACHHHDSRPASFEVRTIAETVAGMLMTTHQRLKAADEVATLDAAAMLGTRLVEAAGSSRSLQRGLSVIGNDALHMMAADGLTVTVGGDIFSCGSVPTDADVFALQDWVIAHRPSGSFATKDVRQVVPGDVADGIVGGVFLTACVGDPAVHVTWYRDATDGTVIWAGDPEKVIYDDCGRARLQPRTSFVAWQEQNSSRSDAWTPLNKTVAETLSRSIQKITNADEPAA